MLERALGECDDRSRAVRAQRLDALGRQVGARRDQPHRPDAVARAHEALGGVPEVHERRVPEPLELADARAHGLGHRRAEWPGRQRHQHDRRAPGAQRGGDGVRHVAQLPRRRQHPLARLVGDARVDAVEHIADRRSRDTGRGRHVGARHVRSPHRKIVWPGDERSCGSLEFARKRDGRAGLGSGAVDALLSLFPPGSAVDADGTLLVGGCRADDLAAEYGTPAMIVSEPALRARAREYKEELAKRWPRSRVVFASKAFPATAIQRVMVEEGLGLDVAGGGEIITALKAGVDPALIVHHGNAKGDEEIALAVEHGIGLVVVDNADDVDRLEAPAPPRTCSYASSRASPPTHTPRAHRPRGRSSGCSRRTPRSSSPASSAARA